MPLTIDLGPIISDNPNWNDIADKPFTSLGQGLVVNDSVLSVDLGTVSSQEDDPTSAE